MAEVRVGENETFESALRRFNVRQWLRSWYVGLFNILALPEWLLRQRDHWSLRQLSHTTVRPDAYTEGDIERYAQA